MPYADPEVDRAKKREYYQANKPRLLVECHRRRLLSRYGITPEEYEALMSKPCAICGAPSKHLDHDHDTGVVRAALCRGCNVGIGSLGDDPARLRAAAEYLERGR